MDKVEKQEEVKVNDTVNNSSKKIKIALMAALALAIAAGVGFFFVWRGASYIITDNARVTTNLIAVSSNIPGPLERFSIHEGQSVSENEVLGWVENGEAMRSPVAGLVIHTNAVQDQIVTPMDRLAVIADKNSIHIQANIEETDIMRLQVGQPAIVTIDGLGNQQFNGYISEIGRITQAELTGNALFFNTGGTFTRITHLIPVEVNIIDDIDLTNLIGVNARVRFPLRHSREIQVTPPISNITTTGVVESVTSRTIYTSLGFRVDNVYAEVGDRVQEGDVLATLDTVDLALTIAQQRAALETARQTTGTTAEDTRRMLQEAQANLANNTNIHILGAEASLSAASLNLESIQRSYDDAMRDYNENTDPQVVHAESALSAARMELETRERNHANTTSLHASGIVSVEEMRQSETALTNARNQYNDARINYQNAREFQRRNLDNLRTNMQSALTSRQSAQEILGASQIAAQQEIERLRSGNISAEATANLEHMELALSQLERHLNDATITAPISGTITGIIAREGTFAMGPLFVIEDTSNLRINTRFREYDLARIYEGMEVQITSDATGSAVYTGIITRINPAADPFSPVVEFEAEVAVTSQETNLRIGMNARLML